MTIINDYGYSNFAIWVEELDYILYRAGYEITEQVGDTLLTKCTDEDASSMPTLVLHVDANAEFIRIAPEMTFPTLVYDPDVHFHDDLAYWTERWAKLGDDLTEIIDYVLHPYDFEE